MSATRSHAIGATRDEGTGKVAEVTLAFWIVKIAATTLGETGGDAASMTLGLGYAASTVAFFAVLAVLVAAQVRARRFHPALYWGVVIATTTAGTTLADYVTRSIGLGYPGGSLLLFALVLLVLGLWRRTLGSVSVASVTSPRVEAFYWMAILASNTLGTALGDWLADSGLGYEGGALVFGAALAVVAGLWAGTAVSRTLLFWVAFILTRPLGATVGDLLTKTHAKGGLDLGTFASSAVLAAFVVVCLLVLPWRAGGHAGRQPPAA